MPWIIETIFVEDQCAGLGTDLQQAMPITTLMPEQKRDVLYDNGARFLRLDAREST